MGYPVQGSGNGLERARGDDKAREWYVISAKRELLEYLKHNDHDMLAFLVAAAECFGKENIEAIAYVRSDLD